MKTLKNIIIVVYLAGVFIFWGALTLLTMLGSIPPTNFIDLSWHQRVLDLILALTWPITLPYAIFGGK